MPRFLSFGVLLGFLLTGLWACENKPEEVEALSRKVIEVETGFDIEGIYSQTANLKAVLTAPEMRRVRADTLYVEFPQSIHVDFYNELGVKESVLQAKYAKYLETLGRIWLQDSVLVYNFKGDTLRCLNLWWIQQEERFYTEDSVWIRTPTQQIDGTGLTAKADFSQYTILHARGPVAVPDSLNAAAN